MSARDVPSDQLRARVAAAMGSRIATFRRPDCGLSAAHRFLVTLGDGRHAFVKAATDDATTTWLRNEHHALTTVAREYMPRVLHWSDPGDVPPLLVTEQLHGHWPASRAGVEWRPGDIDIVLRGIADVSATTAPDGLPSILDPTTSRWREVQRERVRFLRFGLCSPEWFERSVDALAEAELDATFAGDRLVHGDIRSDNVCIVDGRAVFVDWSSAAAGNGEYNLALALPYLRLEGGPPPGDVLPSGGTWGAYLGADLALRAIAQTSTPRWLRDVILRLIAIDLEWAAASLGLPPPDGRGYRSV